ncbi:MAG: hypothetical protein ACPGEC_00700 [Flavobacteriales bacterium]
MNQKDKDFRDKIVKGLEIAYERLIEFKKYKKSELVVMRGDKIVRIKPK